MAIKPLKTLKFPGLTDTYTLLQNDATLTVSGKAADAKVTGERLAAAAKSYTSDSEADLNIADGAGNVLVQFADGHIKTLNFDSASVVSAIAELAVKKWAGKKWAAVGDSLTEVNFRTTLHYHDYIATKTGITVVNLGISGTGYKRAYQSGTGDPFYQRIDEVPTDSDVVTIFGGANDAYQLDYEIGDITDTGTTTICGCINTTFDALYAHMPTVNLGIITSTPWYIASRSADWSPENPGNRAELVAEALVAICKRRSIPCLDLYHCSNLRPANADFRELAYSKDDGDGIHPNELGHALLAPRFEAFLDSLLIH